MFLLWRKPPSQAYSLNYKTLSICVRAYSYSVLHGIVVLVVRIVGLETFFFFLHPCGSLPHIQIQELLPTNLQAHHRDIPPAGH